ncbi:FG-GAP-like repeat-containing protein [Nostoc sp.]|uniref:FG-GAP-like repeat-containing protein n=1 Tax=Nostoc sp. TaxID=1180 RepID=UPI002FF905EB
MTTASTTKHTLVIIDSAIGDRQILAQGIIPTAKVITLNKHQDGIAQISALSKNHPAASIQIIAHGSSGNLQLGNSQLSLDNLHTYRQQLQQWLAAEILIYGCEVARGEIGKTFIEQLHQLTGANIAASAQKIGNARHGGTWELEVKIGQIGSTLALQPEIREAYPGVFATFGTATNFTVGSRPRTVTVGDFNGDGKLDLAAANIDSNNVSVLLGNGTGGFGTATNFSVGSRPFSVTVGDFNADGKLDLAAANIDSNNVSVLLGNGTGGFGTATNFSVGNNPYSVTVGDFNGDGLLDLATANIDSNNVSVLLGNGTGGFGTPTNFTVGNSPRSVTVGDFNGDGKLDLAAANIDSNNVSVLLGNGTGGFGTATNFTVGANPFSVTVGDFNGDGLLDLAAANISSNDVSVLLGNGTGGFGTATNFSVGTTPFSVTVGDFNGDGKLDLAAANVNSYNVSVLLGNGTGSFGTATNFSVSTTPTTPTSVTVGDFNGDGLLDLAAANIDSNNISVLLNNHSATLTIAEPGAPVTTATNTALLYTENDPATAIDSGITVTDVDSTSLSSATVTITNDFVATEDTLAFTNQNGITGTYTNGVLTLTGTATVAQYQTALQSITYQNSSDNPSTTPRTISFIPLLSLSGISK